MDERMTILSWLGCIFAGAVTAKDLLPHMVDEAEVIT